MYKGVKIYRLFATQYSKNKLSGRLLNGITFSFILLIKLLFSRKRDVLLATTNPPFLQWVAWLIGALRRRKYVLLIHDIYPDVAIRLGYMKSGDFITKVWRWLNKKAYEGASAVIVLGEHMRRVIEASSTHLLPVHVIHSWADGSYIRPVAKRLNPFVKKHGLEDKLVVLYSGNLGQAHELETIVEAAERLKDLDELTILFVGEGAKKAKLMSMVEKCRLSNVLFLPPVPYEELPYSLTAGDIGVVTLERGIEGLCEPSKLYGYLAAGLAILALVGENSEVATVVKKHQCGYRLDQGDSEGFVERVRYLLANRGELEEIKRRARECFEHYYDRKIAVSKYLDIIRSI
jgi:glycosyltransferase involved in cell wall biosynthesis